MKKIAILILFALLSTAGFAQLKVAVSHDGNSMDVQFPSGHSIEYKVLMVDVINPGALELQKGDLDTRAQAASVVWEADLRYVYEINYRYALASGEYSEWFTIDPKALLTADGD